LRGWRAARPELEDPLARALESFPVTLDQPFGAGRVLREGQSRRYSDVTDDMLRELARRGGIAVSDLQALGLRRALIVPLTVRQRTIAALSLARVDDGRTGPFGDDVAELLEDLGRRAALAMDTAQRFQFEQRAARTLQRSLLPPALPITRGMTAAARYLPGLSGAAVGGDWYDLIELGDERVGLIVGDVMGRGIAAAAIMGQLRAAVRAYALDVDEPAELLGRLNRFVQSIDETQLTTCVYGVLNQSTNTLVVAAAGHLPPLLIEPGEDPVYLDLEPGLPLGVGGGPYQQSTLRLPPGATVLLYTDGLVEGPDCPIDEGLQRLRDAVKQPVIDPLDLCDEVLTALGRDGHHDDDTALLAVTLTTLASRAGLRFSGPSMLQLDREPQSAGVARTFVADALSSAGLRQQAFVAGLLTSELVTNALRHAEGELRLELAVRDGCLRVDVSDGSHASPRLRPPSAEDEHGRGLLLVDALADRWGSEALASGKRVWFEVGLLSELA
jgi:serine phosphatase RsbU (regulator of sigma subunit)/anti-sigma regulatory factor (Ser/Thr protein kinase)